MAVDTMGLLPALRATPANQGDHATVGALAEAVQDATGESATLACAGAGHTGRHTANAAQAHGTALGVVKMPNARRGFMLTLHQWVIKRILAWMPRLRRLARGHESLPETIIHRTSPPSPHSCCTGLPLWPQSMAALIIKYGKRLEKCLISQGVVLWLRVVLGRQRHPEQAHIQGVAP